MLGPIARIRYRMRLVTGEIECQRMCLIEHVDDEIEKLKRSGLEVIEIVERKEILSASRVTGARTRSRLVTKQASR